MPLRDHFHPSMTHRGRWEALHGGWPMVIATDLNQRLSSRFLAAPRVHLGRDFEVDVAAYERDEWRRSPDQTVHGGNAEGESTTAIWAPPSPTLSLATELPQQDEYEVDVIDTETDRLVAAIELVSPANKDREVTRTAFASKCAALLRKGVCVCIVDVVTTRHANLFAQTLELLEQADASLGDNPPSIYATACRWREIHPNEWELDVWDHPLELGKPLPTLPLWLGDDLAVPLELEASYEAACKALRLG